MVLSNSGRSLSVYETGKLVGSGGGATKPLYSAELKEGLVAAVYPGGGGWVFAWLGIVGCNDGSQETGSDCP